MSKIKDAIKQLRFDDRSLIAGAYWEFIPQDRHHSTDEQLAYIISAMPGMGRYPAKTIAALLAAEAHNRAKLYDPSPRDYAYALPNLAKRALAENPELCRRAMDAMAKYKPVPAEIRNDTLWMLQITIACSIGVLRGIGLQPVECNQAAEPYLAGHNLAERLTRLIAYDASIMKG